MSQATYRILNSLGVEVGQQMADDAPAALTQYALLVDVPLSRLLQIGYTAVLLNPVRIKP